MKGLMILQRKFAPIGNAIASELKNKYGVNEFCGYVIKRNNLDFIGSQKDVKYTGLLLDEDIHNRYKTEKLDIEYLKELEAEYGTPNLWPNIAIDRTLMMNIPPKEYSISPTPPFTHEEMLRILQVRFRAVIDFLNKEKPDFIIGCVIGSIGTFILYNVAKKMGIKIYFPQEARIKNRTTFTEDYRSITGTDKIFKNIRENNYKSLHRQEAVDFLKEFRRSPVTYAQDRIKPIRKSFIEKILLIPANAIRSIAFTVKSTVDYLRSPYKSDITAENPFYALLNKIEKKIRSLRNIDHLYDEPNWNEDFAYFPLHTDPEIATLLFAPFFTNQITLLTQIAKSLPVHFKLYVKEHPVMVDYRPTEYYKELKKIPNLKLINPKTNSFNFNLTDRSKLIITIAGTTGWEGALLKKPVITFGDTFYNTLPMIKKCKTLEDLPYIIKHQLENFEYDENEIIDFVSAIFEDTTAFEYIDFWQNKSYEQTKNDPQFKEFVGLLAKKTGLIP